MKRTFLRLMLITLCALSFADPVAVSLYVSPIGDSAAMVWESDKDAFVSRLAENGFMAEAEISEAGLPGPALKTAFDAKRNFVLLLEITEENGQFEVNATVWNSVDGEKLNTANAVGDHKLGYAGLWTFLALEMVTAMGGVEAWDFSATVSVPAFGSAEPLTEPVSEAASTPVTPFVSKPSSRLRTNAFFLDIEPGAGSGYSLSASHDGLPADVGCNVVLSARLGNIPLTFGVKARIAASFAAGEPGSDAVEFHGAGIVAWTMLFAVERLQLTPGVCAGVLLRFDGSSRPDPYTEAELAFSVPVGIPSPGGPRLNLYMTPRAFFFPLRNRAYAGFESGLELSFGSSP